MGVRNMAFITEPPTSESVLPFLKFLDKYVSHVPGTREIAKFYKENPGKMILDKLTISDIAYTVLVYENSFSVWDENREWKRMTRVEKEANPKVAVQKYFKKSGSKNKKYRDGWTKEGEKYYASLVGEFTALSNNEVFWGGVRDHWTQYCKDNGKCYYEDEYEMADQVDEENSDDDEEDEYVMELPTLDGQVSATDVGAAMLLSNRMGI
jgi:hypothetical protein